jgi:succinate-semialdehyde dehydrogenase/glutarate-semialdehyde dehydrogenase
LSWQTTRRLDWLGAFSFLSFLLTSSHSSFPRSYFFTENISRLHRVASQLEVGMVRFIFLSSSFPNSCSPLSLLQVGANTGAISQVGIPFGGIKESGFGREGAFLSLSLLLFLALTSPSSFLRCLSSPLGSKYGLQDWQNIKLIAIGGLKL